MSSIRLNRLSLLCLHRREWCLKTTWVTQHAWRFPNTRLGVEKIKEQSVQIFNNEELISNQNNEITWLSEIVTNTRFCSKNIFFMTPLSPSARGLFADFNDALRQCNSSSTISKKKECKQNTELNEARMTLIYHYIDGKKRMTGRGETSKIGLMKSHVEMLHFFQICEWEES